MNLTRLNTQNCVGYALKKTIGWNEFFLTYFDISCSAKLKESRSKTQDFLTDLFLLDTAGNRKEQKTRK